MLQFLCYMFYVAMGSACRIRHPALSMSYRKRNPNPKVQNSATIVTGRAVATYVELHGHAPTISGKPIGQAHMANSSRETAMSANCVLDWEKEPFAERVPYELKNLDFPDTQTAILTTSRRIFKDEQT